MSSVEFVSTALRERVSPPSVGAVKARIRHAARRLGWSFSRTRNAWYADDRMSISADEIRDIERTTGLRYGRQEIQEIDDLIDRASTLLVGRDENFVRAFLHALREGYRASDRT